MREFEALSGRRSGRCADGTSGGHPRSRRLAKTTIPAAVLSLLAACALLLWSPSAAVAQSIDAPTNFRVLNADLANGVYEAQARSFDLAWELPASATGLNIYRYELVEGSTCPNQTTCPREHHVQYPGHLATTVAVSHTSAGTFVYEIHSTDGANTSDAAELTVVVPATDTVPTVSVRFGSARYSASEGESVTVQVRLSRDPERTVLIELATDNLGGATNADHSGVPADITFESGETIKQFTVTVEQDDEDDDFESLRIILQRRPALVTLGSPGETAVSLVDDDGVTPPPPTSTPVPTQGGGGGGFGPALNAPKFDDGFRTNRTVPVNAEPGDAVGDPVVAVHPDDLAITYSLSGADASRFDVESETGQILLREGVSLTQGNSFTVNLTATDSAGFGSIIIVDLEVTEAAHHPYDLNGNGTIERDEALKAVSDYFAGQITKDDVLEVISLYFAG